jgi:hypothetical protein
MHIVIVRIRAKTATGASFIADYVLVQGCFHIVRRNQRHDPIGEVQLVRLDMNLGKLRPLHDARDHFRRIFPYFVATTVIAIAIGISLALLIKLGQYIDSCDRRFGDHHRVGSDRSEG